MFPTYIDLFYQIFKNSFNCQSSKFCMMGNIGHKKKIENLYPRRLCINVRLTILRVVDAGNFINVFKILRNGGRLCWCRMERLFISVITDSGSKRLNILLTPKIKQPKNLQSSFAPNSHRRSTHSKAIFFLLTIYLYTYFDGTSSWSLREY